MFIQNSSAPNESQTPLRKDVLWFVKAGCQRGKHIIIYSCVDLVAVVFVSRAAQFHFKFQLGLRHHAPCGDIGELVQPLVDRDDSERSSEFGIGLRIDKVCVSLILLLHQEVFGDESELEN